MGAPFALGASHEREIPAPHIAMAKTRWTTCSWWHRESTCGGHGVPPELEMDAKRGTEGWPGPAARVLLLTGGVQGQAPSPLRQCRRKKYCRPGCSLETSASSSKPLCDTSAVGELRRGSTRLRLSNNRDGEQRVGGVMGPTCTPAPNHCSLPVSFPTRMTSQQLRRQSPADSTLGAPTSGEVQGGSCECDCFFADNWLCECDWCLVSKRRHCVMQKREKQAIGGGFCSGLAMPVPPTCPLDVIDGGSKGSGKSAAVVNSAAVLKSLTPTAL
jgi:hypothetical protein